MKRFDCLTLDCPLLGPHLLEASAGTGKTFTIEHVFVRLLLEADLSLEEILVVTFTRASTRDLKQRIQNHLTQALDILKGESQTFAYLQPFIGSQEAIRVLASTLKNFDQSQIFTIHGFCFQMLKEFAFEAGKLFSVENLENPSFFAKKRREEFFRFLNEGVTSNLLSPEQISPLLSKYSTLSELAQEIFRRKKEPSFSFAAWHEAFYRCVEEKQMDLCFSSLKEDFDCVRTGYKALGDHLDEQIQWLAKSFENPKDPIPFRKLLQYEGSLFSFLHPKNKKIRAKQEPKLHYPGFFEWAAEHLKGIFDEASNQKNILAVLRALWEKWEEKWILQSGILNPDEILKQMRSSIEIPSFLKKVESRFQAVIIDEFQDTDQIQWEIFHKIFLEKPTLKALYLVGDPKQSIYRFRSADVYTYFAAKEFLGEENLYHLDTNFRSSKDLLLSLNAIFSRNWLPLPRTGGNISYVPVKPGSAVSSDLNDDKKALHWIVGDREASFEDCFLPFAIEEIQKLPKDLKIAILVKDRYEAQIALEKMRSFKIPCIAKSHRLLSETYAFQSVRELLEAVLSPEDDNCRSIVESGPFSCQGKSLFYWKRLLEEKGLPLFFSEFLRDQPLQNELSQVLEEIFSWELKEGFSSEGLKRFLDSFERLKGEEGVSLRIEEEDLAVQVLTLHVSKGLEFDIVFALGVASASIGSEEDEEEFNAEKLRQLYVAMTRAKKRLYAPIKKESQKDSPMDLFRKSLEKEEGSMIAYLEELSKTFSISLTEISTPYLLPFPPLPLSSETPISLEAPEKRILYEPSYIQSFTSLTLSQKKELHEPLKLPEGTLPAGKETGTIVHRIFEAIFSSEKEIWKEEEALNALIEKELDSTLLKAWTQEIRAMVLSALSHALSDGENKIVLKDLKKDCLFAEMEFAFSSGSNFIKGFIDLVFIHNGKWYIVDWKTNVLKSNSSQDMEEAMVQHDYARQAAIYKEALKRHFDPMDSFDSYFGGAFYLFLRAGSYVYLNPTNT